MKALLMHREKDFDPRQLLYELKHRDREFDFRQQLTPQEQALIQDLELDTLLGSMAGGDEFLLDVARKAILSGLRNDVDTILYRQQVIKDCMKNVAAIRDLYNLTVETIEGTKRNWWSISSHYASSMLYSSVDSLDFLLGTLKRLRSFAEEQAGRFESEAFTALFATLRKELNEDYLATIRNHLQELKFRKGVLMSSQLGEVSESTNYVLRHGWGKEPSWLERIFRKGPPGYSFRLDERDEAGARILSEMRQRAIGRVAVAVARSADHVMSFVKMLRAELAFYLGCMNLHGQLAAKEMSMCFPIPVIAGQRRHHFSGLYDVCLSLRMEGKVVSNTVNGDGKSLIIITGANQGGKSTFLRGIGLAQLMMQSGIFVGAESFEAELCPELFTHYKREEDSTMKSGKLDEELARMSEIADHVVPNSVVLFNESFAATNEREGSGLAKQIVCALLEKQMKVFYVTHLYEFARVLFDRKTDGALFLRAERKEDGTRTFRLMDGEPLDTSYGEDLYQQIFNQHEELPATSSNGTTSVIED